MTAPSNQTARMLHAASSDEKLMILLRDLKQQVIAAGNAYNSARRSFELADRDDIGGLLRKREIYMTHLVRRRTLISIWEMAAGKTWSSKVKG